jgi:hypothetical protein
MLRLLGSIVHLLVKRYKRVNKFKRKAGKLWVLLKKGAAVPGGLSGYNLLL